MLTGNGTIGALVIGDPLNERIILSHEKLFSYGDNEDKWDYD